MIGLRTARAAFALHHREKRKRRASPEHELQRAVAAYLAVALQPPCFWVSIDAGVGKLSKASAGSAKARGVKAGMPDILVIAPRNYSERCLGNDETPGPNYGRLMWSPREPRASLIIAIELKAGRGKLSAAQVAMHSRLRDAGVRCHVARSIDDVEMILERAGVPLRATAFAFSQKRARAA